MSELLKCFGVHLHLGDCLESMRGMVDHSVDSIVTDPPYELGFMGKTWDSTGIANSVELWREALRVLKPGGHLLAFSGTRTQHRMVCAIEDAGFEIRDQAGWMYGCLDEVTEVATDRGVMPYHKAKIGDRALCYDVEHGEYTYQPILEIVEYDYSDTAYRLVGDFGEQVVSRNHRVIVERGGIEAFQFAEALECEARVPVLESLPALRQAIHDTRSCPGDTKQDVRCYVPIGIDGGGECGGDAAGTTQRADHPVRGLRDERLEACRVASQGAEADVQQAVQRCASWRGMGDACSPGAGQLDAGIRGCTEGAHDGRIESRMEGRADLSESEGCVCGSADQVCALPGADAADGAVGRLCDGAPAGGCVGDQPAADPIGVRAPHQPRRDGQPAGQPDAVCDEQRPQGVRAWGGHRSAVVRVVPFHYTGKVWCLRVPTGAFVAVRNGVAFPTGNSGFPKSLDVSKAIDKAAGVEFDAVPATGVGFMNAEGAGGYNVTKNQPVRKGDTTDAARQWHGWGTALKPAWEPICVARKPLIGTVAANVLAHGTGALNIDGCRVATDDNLNGGAYSNGEKDLADATSYATGVNAGEFVQPTGRWPANILHDGSDEVLAVFPQAKGQQGALTGAEPSSKTKNVLGEFAGRSPSEPRGDAGSAARFFYSPKASKSDRGATNNHPTVKPTELMRYLCRLVTPPGGVVLDPFMGSGSTGKAAVQEGFQFIGCEMSPEYMEIATGRIMGVVV